MITKMAMLSFKKTLNPKPPKPKDVHVQWEDAPGAPPLGAFLTEQARDKKVLGLLRSIGFPGFESLGL